MKNLLLLLFLLIGLSVAASAQYSVFIPNCGGSDDTAKFTSIIATIGSSQGTISLPYKSGTRCAVSNLTIPSNVTLDNTSGSGIKVITGQTLTIVGAISNPPGAKLFYNALSAQGTVVFTGNVRIPQVFSQWWGYGDGTGNDAAATTATTVAAATATITITVGTAAGGVTSFNSRTGAISPATNDYTWAQVNKATSSLLDITTRSASDLSSGTLPDARFPATLPAASGINLTALNATNLGSGTVPLARITGLTVSQFAGGSVTGNGTKFATSTGSLVSGHCVQIDASGNYVDSGSACGGGGGGSGDASTNTNVSVNGELVLFSGTSGKLLQRATGTGYVKATSGVMSVVSLPAEIGVAASDESSVITTGTGKITFRMPYAMTLSSVRASLTTASSSGLVTVNVKLGGTTIFSTQLTIDATEKTSTTAATPAVLSTTALTDDGEITVDIVGAGTNAVGLKLWFLGTK